MEDIEVPLEKVSEDIHHQAMHSAHDGFVNRAALMSAVLAAFAAVSALFAGHDANEAMIAQIRSSDAWAYYQAKGVKAAIAELQVATATDENVRGTARTKLEQYKVDQLEIKARAEEKEHESEKLLSRHESVASAVTLFQVSIAMTAIAVLSRKKLFLRGAFVLGCSGAAWLAWSYH